VPTKWSNNYFEKFGFEWELTKSPGAHQWQPKNGAGAVRYRCSQSIQESCAIYAYE
jgi:catalase (peroxidase I)